MPPKNPNKKNQGRNDNKPLESVTEDPRFRKVHNDPRFLKPKKKDTKVTIDSRFHGMLNSKEFSSGPSVDKYGRKLKQNTAENELKRFYQIDEQEDSDEEGEEEEQSLSDLERELAADEGNRDSDIEAKLTRKYDPMRGIGVDSSDESSDEDEEDMIEELLEEEIPTGDETHRLALLNMDWDYIKAVDIFKVLGQFKPPTGIIKSVIIYPSEFGKERMKIEDMEGPPREIFKEADVSDSEDESNNRIQDEEGNGEDFDQKKLRKYQQDRLKYYIAVIDCDSIETARALYVTCDGVEYESSANIFDLRYIPNERTFDDEPTDVATSAPDNYKAVSFSTEALQHTKVKLTWDQDDPKRSKVTRRAFTEADLSNVDFNAYLASSDDDEDPDDVSTLREKYRKLLAGLGSESVFEDSREEKEEGDMEITFTPGLSAAVASTADSKLSTTEDQEETTIEKYMRKQREKRKIKKERRSAETAAIDSDNSDDDEELNNDPFFREAAKEMEKEGFKHDKPSKKEKKTQKKGLSKEERMDMQRQKAELELLMDDDAKKGDGFDMKEVLKREKQEKKKKKGKKSNKTDVVEDDFEIDVEDPRFAALHDSHHFAVDPTNPQFKKTKSMKKLLDARQQKRTDNTLGSDEWKKDAKPKSKQSAKEPKEDTALSQLVASVKRKGALTKDKLGKRQKT